MEGHELYTAGHMIEAAVAYYQATGKEKFLNIARKMQILYAGYLVQVKDRSEAIRAIRRLNLHW